MSALLHESKLQFGTAIDFVLAGNATFTLRSVVTGVRYTFKVVKKEQTMAPTVWFVSLLTGPNNESDYNYLGMISNRTFRLTGKSAMKADSTPVVAFKWFYSKLANNVEPQNLEIWHVGRCGRCGRTLTVPESIELGFGPECMNRMAA